MDGAGIRNVSSNGSMVEWDELDLSRLLERPRPNIDRQLSLDERSIRELSIVVGNIRTVDSYECMYSPGVVRSALQTPSSSARNSLGAHPMVAEEWDALRGCIVFFLGQRIGTIAAYDHASEKVLNHDRVYYIAGVFIC